MKKMYGIQEAAKIVLAKGKEDNKMNTAEITTLLRWKLSNKGVSKFKNRKDKLEEWIRIKGKATAEIDKPSDTEEIIEAEEDIPSIEETVLARKRADSVTDAKMVIFGNMSSSEIQEMLSTKIQHETQTSVVYDLDDID